MKKVGGILVLALLIFAAAAGFGAIYYFTQLETQKSDLLEAKADLKELREQVRKLEQTQVGGARESTSTNEGRVTSPADGESGYVLESGEKMSESGTMIVDAPREGQSVSNTVTVSGRAIAFESTVNIRICDSDGNELKETNTMTDAPDAGRFGEFNIDMFFDAPKTATGTVQVFEYSARDGSEINKVIVPVDFDSE
jgi:hypothetical protein